MSVPNDTSPDTQRHAQLVKRDAETLLVLGLFVTVLSIPVLIGTLWAENTRQTIVNVAAGVVLLVIGLVILLWGWRTSNKVKGR